MLSEGGGLRKLLSVELQKWMKEEGKVACVVV